MTLTGSRILHLEDSPDFAQIVRFHLEANKCIVEHVSHCADFFDAIQLRSFDLVLLDLQLPDGSGIDALRELRAGREFDHVPAVILSGVTSAAAAEEAFEEGANAFITKTFGAEHLLETIRLLLSDRDEDGPGSVSHGFDGRTSDPS
jgi:two-component system, OmpR family, response regulator